MGVDAISQRLNIDAENVKNRLESARLKLLAVRNKRQKPFVDAALYTSLNGMMIAAYLKAYRALGDEGLKEFAIKSLETILHINVEGGKLLHSEGVKAQLDDYIYIIDALISAYEVSANGEYFALAEGFMETCLERFWDSEGGGFFDTEEEVVGLRLKGIEDVPRPSANALAVIVLLKLATVLNKEGYRQYAEKSLNTFSTDAQLMQIHGAYFFCGLDTLYRMLKLDIQAPSGSAMAKSALSTYHPYSCIIYGNEDNGSIIPCVKNTCYEPIDNPEQLKQFVNTLK
jgi:uncharacterized protein YyaL (SSP411 family)